MTRRLTALLLAAALIVSCAGITAAEEDELVSRLEALYTAPDRAYATEVRWWMAEGAHTDETLLEGAANAAGKTAESDPTLTLPENAVAAALVGKYIANVGNTVN